MKKLFTAFLLGFVLISCSKDKVDTESDCLNADYYYYSDEKIVLNDLNHNYLTIGFFEDVEDIEIIKFINSSEAFENITRNDLRVVGHNNYKYVIARFKERKSCVEIVAKADYFVKQSQVVYANKTYNTDFFDYFGEFDFMVLGDEFFVKLKEDTSMVQFENLTSQIEGVSIIKEDDFERNVFVMSSISKNRTMMETVNLFFDKGLFVYVEPNFHYDIL